MKEEALYKSYIKAFLMLSKETANIRTENQKTVEHLIEMVGNVWDRTQHPNH